MMKKIGLTLYMVGIISIMVGCNSKETPQSKQQEMKSTKIETRQNDSLSPKKGRSFDIKLMNNGQPALQILISDNASTIDTKAASMLKEALDAGTGSSFKIVKENDYTDGAVFSIGDTDFYKKTGLRSEFSLDEDGYMIAERDGSIFLIGGSRRGSISPVIAIIEEDFGGRLYSRDEELQMPSLADEQVVVLREYVPQFKIRTMFQYESFTAEYQLFNRVGTLTSSYDKVPAKWGGSTKIPAEFFVHTFAKLLPNDKYFDKHPEYFALINGKRKPQGHGGGANFCMTNPDVRKIVTARVLKELKTLHPYKLFDISPNDTGGGFCQCDKCQAIAQREGGEAGPLVAFVNSVAKEVKKTYPEVNITTMAYLESNKPPKDIRPDDNVIIRLANDTASFPYPMFFLEESDVFYPNMKNWIKLGSKIIIWDYVVDYKAWQMPRPNLPVIDHNIDTYAKYGIYGLFLQSSHYGAGENQGKLRSWVYSKKMWDPSRKMKDLVRDYNYGYFGKAADLMQEYSDLLDAEWKNFHDNNTFKDSKKYPNKFIFSKKFYPQARAIFDKALKLSANDSKLQDKIELEFVSILFYRLQMMPPSGDADRKSYIEDLNTYIQLTEKYKVKWISERTTKTKQRIVEWKRKYNIVSADDKPVTVKLQLSDISRMGDGAKKIDDISAPGGQCVKIPIRGNAWVVQWFFGSALFNDTKYSVRIQLKADKKSSAGNAFGYGLYATKTKKVPLNGIMDASDISDNGYGWVELGNINGSDASSAYFYIAQIPNSSVANIYITTIEIIPEGEEGYNDAPVIRQAKAETVNASPITKGANGEIIFNAGGAKVHGSARRNGAAVAISPASDGWHTQWVLGKNLPVGKYSVRALIKISGQKAGKGMRVGIFSPGTTKEWFRSISSVAGIPVSDKFQWVDIGVADIPAEDPKAYLFACSLGDNSFDSLLVKSIEFKAGGSSTSSPAVKKSVPAPAPVAAAAVKNSAGAVVFSPGAAKITGRARLIDSNILIPPDYKGWDTKWILGNNLSAGKYNVRALVKIKGQKAGNGLRVGIFSPSSGKEWFRSIRPVVNVPVSDDYQWIDFGTVNVTTVEPDAYLFVCSFGDNSFDSLSVKSIEFNANGSSTLSPAVKKSTPAPAPVAAAAVKNSAGATVFSAGTANITGRARLIDSDILIPPDYKGWDTKWILGNNLSAGKYSVRALVKIKGQKAGNGLRVGIFSPSSGKEWFRSMRPVVSVPVSDDYQWIDFGTADVAAVEPDAYLFVCSFGDNSFDSLLVKSIEFNANGSSTPSPAVKKSTPAAPPVAATAVKNSAGATVFSPSAAKITGRARLIDSNILIPPDYKGWDTKWILGNNLSAGKYNVRALVKIKGQKAGNGLRIGIFSPSSGKEWFRSMRPVVSLPVSDDYQWIDFGVADIPSVDPKAYLFVCSLGDNSFDSLLVKSIEFKMMGK